MDTCIYNGWTVEISREQRETNRLQTWKEIEADHRAKYYPNCFRSRYQLHGSDWVKQLEPDDLQVFIEIGMTYNLHGRLGGLARAKTAARDSRGRFIKATP